MADLWWMFAAGWLGRVLLNIMFGPKSTTAPAKWADILMLVLFVVCLYNGLR